MPLERITFVKGHQKTDSAENAVDEHIKVHPRLQKRDFNEAVVRSAPTGTWHATDTDPREHLTVDFKKDGQHVTTHHVYRAAENPEGNAEENPGGNPGGNPEMIAEGNAKGN